MTSKFFSRTLDKFFKAITWPTFPAINPHYFFMLYSGFVCSSVQNMVYPCLLGFLFMSLLLPGFPPHSFPPVHFIGKFRSYEKSK